MVVAAVVADVDMTGGGGGGVDADDAASYGYTRVHSDTYTY